MKNMTTVIAAISAFVVTSLLGYIVIPYLKKLKFGQTILDIGPNWHKSKEGTPTMGGVMMVAGVIVALILSIIISIGFKTPLATELRDSKRLLYMISGLMLGIFMGLIGFLDDFIKIVKKRNLGLTAKQKTFLQFIVAAAYLAALYFSGMRTTYIPFVKPDGMVDITHGLGLIFWPVALMFIYGFTNAVNLTDGLDGLASSVTLVVSCSFMLASGMLNIFSVNTLSAALAGACAGFIVWNAKPAKVFMGDTGSMFLGGMVVGLSFGIEKPVLLILAGCLYFIEAISVMMQVTYFKLTKKRIFKMAPLHHHFEMCGWSEQKVVFVFSFIAFIGCFISLLNIIFNW